MAEFLEKVQQCLEVRAPFTVVVDDPSGNSHVQNPLAPQEDPAMIVEHYERTREQNLALGMSDEEMAREAAEAQREQDRHQQLEGRLHFAHEQAQRGERERIREKVTKGPADLVGIQSRSLPGEEFSRPAGSNISVLRAQSVEELSHAMQAEDVEKDVVLFQVPCGSCGSEQASQRMVKVFPPLLPPPPLAPPLCRLMCPTSRR